MEKVMSKSSKTTEKTEQRTESTQPSNAEVAPQTDNVMFLQDIWQNFKNNYQFTKRSVWILDDIIPETCNTIITTLNFWIDASKQPVYIYINSCGGDVTVAFAIVDTIKALQAAGSKVYTIVTGVAASAAAVIALAGSKGCRWCYPHGRIMYHSARYSFLTDMTESDMQIHADELTYANSILAEMLKENTKLNDKEIKNVLSKDTYYSAEEAKKLNIINEIGVIAL